MNFSKKLLTFVFALIVGLNLFAFVVPATVLAQAPAQDQGLVPCGSFSDNPCQLIDLFRLVIVVTNFLIEMAGIVAVVVIIFAGYSLVVAAGNIEAVTEAKKLLVGAFIGFFFVLASMVLANFLIFGGREIIPGTHVIRGEKASITKCPIAYIMQNDTCGDVTSTTTPANNAPVNNTQPLPFQIPPGRAQGQTAMALDIDPVTREFCTIKPTAWFDGAFSIRTAFAQSRQPADCGSIKDGFLGGSRHTDFPQTLIIQQDQNIALGSPKNQTCSSVSQAGCGMISMIHAIERMQSKGYVYAGSWTQQWLDRGSLSSASQITSVDWWPRIYQQNTGYFTCENNGAVYHSAPSDILKDGHILRNVNAYQSTATTQAGLMDQIELALDRNGVAIALVKGPPFNTGCCGSHFILIWEKYNASDDKGNRWYKVADSNINAQVGQVRKNVLQSRLQSVTVVYPTSDTP